VATTKRDRQVDEGGEEPDSETGNCREGMSNEAKKRTKSGRMRCKRREVSEKHEERNEEEKKIRKRKGKSSEMTPKIFFPL